MIGRSNLNGKAMAQLLLQEDCTVTITHSRTKNIQEHAKKADILIVGCGVPKMIKEDWIKEGVDIIDIGINFINDIEGKNGKKEQTN